MVRLVLLWIIMGVVIASPFLCFAEESLIPVDPAGWVDPGIPDLFEVDGKDPGYEVTRNHLHIGFRWQPYADQPKNPEADIEMKLVFVGYLKISSPELDTVKIKFPVKHNLSL